MRSHAAGHRGCGCWLGGRGTAPTCWRKLSLHQSPSLLRRNVWCPLSVRRRRHFALRPIKQKAQAVPDAKPRSGPETTTALPHVVLGAGARRHDTQHAHGKPLTQLASTMAASSRGPTPSRGAHFPPTRREQPSGNRWNSRIVPGRTKHETGCHGRHGGWPAARATGAWWGPPTVDPAAPAPTRGPVGAAPPGHFFKLAKARVARASASCARTSDSSTVRCSRAASARKGQ